MIKINLLSEGRSKLQKPKASTSGPAFTSEPANVWLVALIALALLVVGGRYFMLKSEINANSDEIAMVQKEVDALRPIILEVEQFEARKAELEHKIAVINDLKANQRGPVEIMDQVSRALPEMLWLRRLQSRGNTITLNGQAFNTNAVANFLDNLDHVDAFAEPVLRDTASRRGAFNFVITFSFDGSAAKTNKQEKEQAAADGAAG